MILNAPNIEELRRQIQKIKKQNPEEEIIIKAQDEEFNRKALEIKNVDVLLSPEIHNRKDRLKQRDSGLNEYLCRLATKNNVKIAVNLDKIKKLDKKEKALTLARIMQNIRLCKKIGTEIIFYPKNQYKKQDIIAFFAVLKGSTEQAKIVKINNH